ncbi:MAG: TonB-dependent receptor, partial [Sandaracinaceae bacterium]|nr:TonB-dependent receptor [Sandaracinaceae bacterium]
IEGGGYLLLLPPGTYTVRSYYDLYHGVRRDRVRVRRGVFTDLTLTLDPIVAEALDAEEVEIVYRADTSTAAAQDQLRQASSGIGEGMGSQQMSRQGASDAGGAASRVVGVTLEGTNLQIRGLGGRYTTVLLNGIPLPSTDPDVPAVDLDLFPASIIDSLQISKAFQPDLPANFAGGVLDIRTVRFPRSFMLQLGVGVGLNTLSTFQDTLTYRGGSLDGLGFDDGTRAFPTGLPERIVISRTGRYQSFDALEAAAERFPNIWQYERQLATPPFSIEGVVGDSIDLGGGRRFGYLVTADYDYSIGREIGINRPRPTIAADGSLATFNDYGTETGTEEARLSALGTASLELGQDDVVTLLTMFNRSAEDGTERQVGSSGEIGGTIERWQLQWIARTLWFNQLRGDHRNMFGTRLRLRWSVFGSYGSREEPDRRTVTYGPNGSLYRWLEKSQSGERFYSNLEQLDLGGTAELRFPLWSEAWGTVGAFGQSTSRSFGNRRLRMMQDPRNMDQTVYQAPVEQLFDEQSIGTLTRMQELTNANDGYDASQGYFAGFAMLETPVVGPLSLTGGARVEIFDQQVRNRSPFPDEMDDLEGSSRTDVDVLPAASLRLQLDTQVFLRAAYGMTVSRPQVRELASYRYYDFIRDRNITGDPNLARTLIQNADLRWEWFFGEGEILALTAFYKYFDQPIELQIRNQTNYDSQYINAQFAHTLGGEAELRFNFRRFAPVLEALTFGANFAAAWSTVSLPDELSGAVQSDRPLVGQAPYVANLSLQFDEPASGLSASVIYNVTGPRITDVGTRVNDQILPNIERAPFHSLDVVLGWRFAEHFRLRFKVRNLLLQTQDYYQGAFLTQRQEVGMSFSLSLGYQY